MVGETLLVVASSSFIVYKNAGITHFFGFIGLHLTLVLGSYYPISDNVRNIKFRHKSDSGIVLGCLLIPMVLISQLNIMQQDASANHQVIAALQVYLASSQLMGMSLVTFLQTKKWWLPVLNSVLVASTVKYYSGSDVISITVLLLLFYVILLMFLWLFPGSCSIGEAILIAQTLTFLAVDSCSLIHNRLHFVSPSISKPPIVITRSIFTYWLQILLLGSVITGILLLPVFYYISIVSDTMEMYIGSVCFYLVIFLVFFSFLLPWSYLMMGGVNPFTWVMHYILHSKTRFYLLMYWSLIVTVSVIVVMVKNVSASKAQSTTITRKYFHVLAIAVFVPGIMFDSQLMHLAASVALAAFLFLEYVRLGRIQPFGHILHESLQVFLDDKDCGDVILTHIYLLIGCACPVWLYPDVSDKKDSCSIAMYSGILSLGVGDTLASLIGKLYGRWKWPGSAKTIEGTVAGFAGQVITLAVLTYLGVLQVSNWIPVSVCIAVGSLLEAWTTQIDNLVLPPFLYALLLSACS